MAKFYQKRNWNTCWKRFTICRHWNKRWQLDRIFTSRFIGIQAFAERDELKLHKFYVSPQFQGKGIGNALFEKAISDARKFNCSRFFLNVNRFNKAIQYYETKGMRICKQEDIAIGNGYLMEDYVMELMLK